MMERRVDDIGPWIPGKASRLEWAEPGDPDQLLVRQGVQENGAHLFVMYLPVRVGGSTVKTLVECYWPDEMRAGSFNQLDPRQREDFKQGRIVVWSSVELEGTIRLGGSQVGSINVFWSLSNPMIEEVRRNNRNARSELRRSYSGTDLMLEIERDQEKKEDALMSDWTDMYVEAYEDTAKFAMGKPRVSQYVKERN